MSTIATEYSGTFGKCAILYTPHFDDKLKRTNVINLFGTKVFLEETWNNIAEYTRKVGEVKMGEKAITHIRENEYSLNLDSILPQLVSVLYGKHNVTNMSGDETAPFIAAGLTPVHKDSTAISNEKVDLIPLSELSSGDLVAISISKYHNYYFVYLGTLSIAMEEFDTITIKPTVDILKKYNYPKDFLKISKEGEGKKLEEPTKFIQIYRKKENWKLPKEIVDAFFEFYKVTYNYNYYGFSSDRLYNEVKSAVKNIRQLSNKAQKDRDLDVSEKNLWKQAEKRVYDYLPFSMNEEEMPSPSERKKDEQKILKKDDAQKKEEICIIL